MKSTCIIPVDVDNTYTISLLDVVQPSVQIVLQLEPFLALRSSCDLHQTIVSRSRPAPSVSRNAQLDHCFIENDLPYIPIRCYCICLYVTFLAFLRLPSDRHQHTRPMPLVSPDVARLDKFLYFLSNIRVLLH